MALAPMTREYRIASEPRGPAYESLLAFCAEAGAWCSLVDHRPKAKGSRGFLAKAEPHAIGVDPVTQWPGGGVGKGAVALWRFALVPEFVSLLMECSKGLYGWKAPQLPEDMAFYRPDGSVLLGSIAHEHIGWMNLNEEEARCRLLGSVDLQGRG